MIILTEEIEKKIPRIYTPDEVIAKRIENIDIIIRFFCPQNGWEWFVTEGEKDDTGEWIFLGYVKTNFKEWKSFSLRDLENFESKTGFQVIRDPYFLNKKIKDILWER